jgi:hypothetical protein
MSRRAVPEANTGLRSAGCPMSRRAAKGHEGARFLDPKANTEARSAKVRQ